MTALHQPFKDAHVWEFALISVETNRLLMRLNNCER